MAKGQQKSNREAKKPKKSKKPTSAAPFSLSSNKAPMTPQQDKKK